MRNIIILKSHLPTLLFVQQIPWPSIRCTVGMKSSPLYSAYWGTQLIKN